MKGWLVAGAVGVLLLAVIGHLTRRYIERETRWKAEKDTLVAARKQADQVAKAAERATEVERRRQTQLQRRIAALERKKVVVTDTVLQTVPDTCKPVVTALVEQVAIRDSIIEVKDAYLASYDRQLVYAYQKNVAAVTKIAELEHLTRKPKRSVLIPRFGVGGACGAGLQGPDCVAGVTLSWSF